jgi:hypothetical protein
MRPDYLVCCRTSDPDPACEARESYVLADCLHCTEEIRVSLGSLPDVILGAKPICIQCAVQLPGAVFVQAAARLGRPI